ncbi:hypothetical protein Baya_14908 [Bagarius yarrelli]|uniref:Uncharacterized protein n=1 Tax=Bagarius yarrelli TaxID=175774 RepID=A0A556VA37_BAGYA|nr:hypothetical protein Baya_14908 [Bagarius yarrelli]
MLEGKKTRGDEGGMKAEPLCFSATSLSRGMTDRRVFPCEGGTMSCSEAQRDLAFPPSPLPMPCQKRFGSWPSVHNGSVAKKTNTIQACLRGGGTGAKDSSPHFRVRSQVEEIRVLSAGAQMVSDDIPIISASQIVDEESGHI